MFLSRLGKKGATQESRFSVRDILLLHIGHMDQHVADIQAIRARYRL